MTDCNYFLASSPRHLLLFAGLALERAANAHNRLFFIEHIPAAGVAAYLDMLRQWPDSPFDQCIALEADYRPQLVTGDSKSSRKSLKKAFRKRNRDLLERALAESPPDAVYASCDDFFESQYLLHRTQQLNPQRRAIYVEDGVSVYEYSYQRTHLRNRPKEWIRAVRYFPWWRPSPLPGASGWLTEGRVAWPALVLAPFRRMDLSELPRDLFLTDQFRRLARIMGAGFNVDVDAVTEADVLIAVTHSKWSGLLPGYRDRMRGICHELLDAGKRVAVKPHPRDPDPDPLGLADHPNLYRVPPGVMFEILVVLAETSGLFVVGDASTSLVATRWLRPDADVIALRHDPDGVDGNYLEQLFSAIGVDTITNPAALTARCLAHCAVAENSLQV